MVRGFFYLLLTLIMIGGFMAKEYWWCRIGPIEREKVPEGGDFPLRQAVKDAFLKTTGENPKQCSSGWGMTEDEARKIAEVQHEHFMRRQR